MTRGRREEGGRESEGNRGSLEIFINKHRPPGSRQQVSHQYIVNPPSPLPLSLTAARTCVFTNSRCLSDVMHVNEL